MSTRAGQRSNGPPDNGSEPRRVVLLGASNVTRSFSVVLDTAGGSTWGRPLEVMAAIGHGRSYGQDSSFCYRSLPGILQCGLWEALDPAPPARTAALVTDIGNDVMYDAPVDEIASWLDQCLDRLRRMEARTLVTMLPVENVMALSQRRYEFYRRLLFSQCHLTLETIAQRAQKLNDIVKQLAVSHGAQVVEQRTKWYGLDPIHIRPRLWSRVWREIMGGWLETGKLPPAAPLSIARAAYLYSLAPQRRHIFGRERLKQQPVGRLRDGTTIAIY